MFRQTKHCYGHLTHNQKQYMLIFGHPYEMLTDKNISWEAKGYLCHLTVLPDEISLSLPVISELIKFGYLVEEDHE